MGIGKKERDRVDRWAGKGFGQEDKGSLGLGKPRQDANMGAVVGVQR